MFSTPSLCFDSNKLCRGFLFFFAPQQQKRRESYGNVKDLLIEAHLWTCVSCTFSRRSCKRAEPETIGLPAVMGCCIGWRKKIDKSRRERDWCRACPAGKLRVRLETGHLYRRFKHTFIYFILKRDTRRNRKYITEAQDVPLLFR